MGILYQICHKPIDRIKKQYYSKKVFPVFEGNGILFYVQSSHNY